MTAHQYHSISNGQPAVKIVIILEQATASAHALDCWPEAPYRKDQLGCLGCLIWKQVKLATVAASFMQVANDAPGRQHHVMAMHQHASMVSACTLPG